MGIYWDIYIYDILVIKWDVQPVADTSNLTIHKLFRIIDEIVGGIFHYIQGGAPPRL